MHTNDQGMFREDKLAFFMRGMVLRATLQASSAYKNSGKEFS